MRKATLPMLVFVVCAHAATAQLTITPRAGMEQSFTTLKHLDGQKTTLDNVTSPQLALRFDYRFKNVHGPFVGLATSRIGEGTLTTFDANGVNTGPQWKSINGEWRLRLEAGYMYNSPAIKLGKSKSAPDKASKPAAVRSSCGGYAYVNRCTGGAQSLRQSTAQAAKKAAQLSLRIQPFAGITMTPGSTTVYRSETSSNPASQPGYPNLYESETAKWSTGVIGGTSFELSKGANKKIVVGIQYLHMVSALGFKTLPVMLEGPKGNTTPYRSVTSAWNAYIGVPVNLGKKKPSVAKQVQAPVIAPARQEIRKQETPKKSGCARVCGKWQ